MRSDGPRGCCYKVEIISNCAEQWLHELVVQWLQALVVQWLLELLVQWLHELVVP